MSSLLEMPTQNKKLRKNTIFSELGIEFYDKMHYN